MKKPKTEVVKKWYDNPQALVDKINSSTDKCIYLVSGNDIDYYRMPVIYSAELRYGKYVIVNIIGGSEVPIFEGVDKIEFFPLAQI